VHLSLLLLSQLCISVLCFCCALCSVSYFDSMNYASSVYFSSCPQHAISPCVIPLYKPPSLLCSAYLFSLCIFCILYSQCFCMLSPCRVLCLIIIATLQLLWWLNPCVHHHWVLCRDSLASPAVETLRLLCHSRAHSLCCSSRLQQSYICQ
jgi:hypothetical protein